MSVKATEIRKGNVILTKEGDLLLVTDYSHATPGNWRAIIQIKVRNLVTGQTSQFRPNAGDTFETAFLDRKKCQYLYQEANGDYVFMDQASFEQCHVPKDLVADKMAFVKESDEIDVTFHETSPIGIELPPQVVLEVTEAEAAVKGNSATGVKKEVVLETGLRVKVPMHVGIGDKVKVSTDSGDFQGRA